MMAVLDTDDDLPPVNSPLLVELIVQRIKSEWMGRGLAEMDPDSAAIEAQVAEATDLIVQEHLKAFRASGRVW